MRCLLPLTLTLLTAYGSSNAQTPDTSLCPKPLSIPGASCPDATLYSVKPPVGNPKSNHFHITERALEKLPVPQQPEALAKALADLEQGTVEERMAKLRAKVVTDLVFVKGGSFTMGDFTPLLNIPGITRMTYNEDDKHLHEVTLSDFYIGRYKATYAELNVFTDATGRPRLAKEKETSDRDPTVPAGMYWQTARDYCQWLGKLTGYTFDLPTEAQWEYAARSRGQFFMIPTDNGNIEFGRNTPYELQSKKLRKGIWNWRYPIALFPPNPLGLYDMQYNGKEWILDWYAEDAYEKSASRDPQGPTTGTKRVTRGWAYGDSLKIGVSTWRRAQNPEGWIESRTNEKYFDYLSPQVRCVAAP